MVNAMNTTDPLLNSNLDFGSTDMKLNKATFGQGNCGTDKGKLRNKGIKGEFTDVTNSTVDPPILGKSYGIKTSSSHNYEATFNPCDTDGSNQFFMKMRFKPVKKGKDSFNTANCGTNDKVEFKIIAAAPSMAPSATPTKLIVPIKKTSLPSLMPSNEPSSSTQEPDKKTPAPSPAPSSAKGKGKGPKSPGKSRVRKTLRGY
jgi:hypothetical protein